MTTFKAIKQSNIEVLYTKETKEVAETLLCLLIVLAEDEKERTARLLSSFEEYLNALHHLLDHEKVLQHGVKSLLGNPVLLSVTKESVAERLSAYPMLHAQVLGVLWNDSVPATRDQLLAYIDVLNIPPTHKAKIPYTLLNNHTSRTLHTAAIAYDTLLNKTETTLTE